ncbi:hypothetical protein M1N89_02665, partial [Dehalococcoidia bacterium]|nr:hypothetical protein [Dehalococcoidia bacterium]
KEGLLYLVEVPSDTHVYLERPRMVPRSKTNPYRRPTSAQFCQAIKQFSWSTAAPRDWVSCNI